MVNNFLQQDTARCSSKYSLQFKANSLLSSLCYLFQNHLCLNLPNYHRAQNSSYITGEMMGQVKYENHQGKQKQRRLKERQIERRWDKEINKGNVAVGSGDTERIQKIGRPMDGNIRYSREERLNNKTRTTERNMTS